MNAGVLKGFGKGVNGKQEVNGGCGIECIGFCPAVRDADEREGEGRKGGGGV